ncbi:MAG: hypothetical protein AVDCRST_MAG60-2432, partial [uncultured Nocardioides sp.]
GHGPRVGPAHGRVRGVGHDGPSASRPGPRALAGPPCGSPRGARRRHARAARGGAAAGSSRRSGPPGSPVRRRCPGRDARRRRSAGCQRRPGPSPGQHVGGRDAAVGAV